MKEILDAIPRTGLLIVLNTRGRPYTGDGFRTEFTKLKSRLAAAGKIGEGITFHGLRHTVATRLADAGCDAETIAAITGHKSPSMVAKYTNTADQRRRAQRAFDVIDGNK